MIPRREEEVEPTPATPLSPRSSTTSNDSRFLYDDDFLESPVRSPASDVSVWDEGKKPHSRVRHAIGIALLLATVFLWTASNFLASTIFADSSYDKPYFVTYVNTAFFLIPLIPMALHHLWAERRSTTAPQPLAATLRSFVHRRAGKWTLLRDHETPARRPSKASDPEGAELLLGSSTHGSVHDPQELHPDAGLTLHETAKLALEFCILWFLANYFAAACLAHTTVASSTILASTSSIWTLLCGALLRVERFTLRKLVGVAASLAGVALISSIDASGQSDADRGSFPHKAPRELALGDAMAFGSAVLYGFYAVLMKKRIGSESRVNMPLFFGLVGLANVLLLWPGLVVLHLTRVETFELPPTNKILTIVLVNSASSLVSDFCWAYAMLLTSPLVVSVGLSLTIPLSLVGQMVLDAQYASWLYWVGAAIMVVSFLFINREERRDEEEGVAGGYTGVDGGQGGLAGGEARGFDSRRSSRASVR
ncbi:vacuolar membrane protein [Boeremia exigua]|uniref:vacuolar membrane protein n=1 Tax=Boeremia exigua TaxID=749465 RepID=UPI001E8D035C|nr:vacuolar membrane protein [Boeremia exigua]KAH6642099.1 vacuolar membrane protein [Boeremia exigua]